jgi:hypothetical protein
VTSSPAQSFLPTFDERFAGLLGVRSNTFRKIFEHLESLGSETPLIVETGCAREKDNWSGDGQSTLLFDSYLAFKGSGQLFSVDIDPDATRFAREATGERTHVETSDSVPYLHKLCMQFMAQGRIPDVLYLDSYDVNFLNAVNSAVHHLKEFCAIRPCLGPDTLVVIDDCPKHLLGWQTGDNAYCVVGIAGDGGKGRYLIDYLRATGATVQFEEYQVGFLLCDAALPPREASTAERSPRRSWFTKA